MSTFYIEAHSSFTNVTLFDNVTINLISNLKQSGTSHRIYSSSGIRYESSASFSEKPISVSFTCNTGYKFKKIDSGVKLNLQDNSTSPSTYTRQGLESLISLSNDNRTLTLLIDDYNDIASSLNYSSNILKSGWYIFVYMNYEIIQDVSTEYTITQNLTNCISDYSQTQVEEGTQITINLTPETGYEFTNTPSYSIGDNTFNFTQTETGYTATFAVTNDVIVNASASAIVVYHSIIQNLTHCTSDYSQSQVEEGEQITINLTPETGYEFTTTPTYSMGGITFNFTQTQSGYTANITVNGDVVVNASASEVVVYNEIEQNLTNCTSSFSGNRLVYGEEYTITLTVNSGYYFATTPTYRDDYGVVLPMDINSDRTIATCTFTSYSKQVINGAAALIPTQKKYEFIGVYNPTSNELKQISAKRFISEGSIKALQDYVISLKKLYCNVESIGKESVYLGEYSTNVSCNVLSGDFFEFNLGDININEYYSNSNDYNNTSIKGYLPFIGFVNLPVTQFMNETINLTYRVNPITGDCMAIYKDSDGNDLQAFSGVICFDIPIKYREHSSIQTNSVNDNVWYLMNNLTPYVEVETNIEYEPTTDLFGKDDNRQGLISSFSGMCIFSDIELNMGDMSQDEYNEIISILKTGVIL